MAEPVAFVYAFWVGMATFFSPCSVGLIPAYVGHFLGGTSSTVQNPARSALRGLRLGVVASLGFLLVFFTLAVVASQVPLGGNTAIMPTLGIVIGILMVATGVWLLLGQTLSVPVPRFAQTASLRSVFLFGLAYAAASIACTFSVFLSIVLIPITQGDALGMTRGLLGFALGMMLMMVMVSGAAAVSQDGVRRFLSRAVPVVQKLAALLLVVGGVYILFYWAKVLAVT